jgi:hypothetical protein
VSVSLFPHPLAPPPQPYITKVDDALNAGLRTLTWKSHGIDAYINDCMAVVRGASDVLDSLKRVMFDVRTMLGNWSAKPLFERTKAKPLSCDTYDGLIKTALHERCHAIAVDGRSIGRMLKEANKIVKVRGCAGGWGVRVCKCSHAGLAQRTAALHCRHACMRVCRWSGGVYMCCIHRVFSSTTCTFGVAPLSAWFV